MELDSWLGTPWAHRGAMAGRQLAIRGEGGDCVTILLTALYNLKALEPLDLPAHVAAPGMAADDDVAESIARFVRPFIAEGRLMPIWPKQGRRFIVGDFLAFKLGGARTHHLGMYRGGTDHLFWHAPGPGQVFSLASLKETGDTLQMVYRLLKVPVTI